MIREYSIPDTSIESLFNSLDGYELSYSYRGEFTSELTDSILSLSETNMEVNQEPVKNRKKVYFIMVESLQNITRHKESEIPEGFFSIHKAADGFLITSGNIVESENVIAIKEKLEKINSMSAEQLKEYYYEVLNAGAFSEKGGAGLGLIEMVRKSGNKLCYDFTKLDDKYSFFYFQINVSTSPNAVHTEQSLSDNLSLAKGVHQVVTENNVKLFFHGKFEHESLKGLISMTESSLASNRSSAFKKVVVAAMIEMLQNICYHGVDKHEGSSEKPGMIIVTEDDEQYWMITGNYIANDQVEKFTKHVEYINGLDNEGLNKLFGEVILKENKIGEKGAGLGLIDLRFKTRNKIETSILQRSATRSFLIVKTHIHF
jgi:hypothetical protein